MVKKRNRLFLAITSFKILKTSRSHPLKSIFLFTGRERKTHFLLFQLPVAFPVLSELVIDLNELNTLKRKKTPTLPLLKSLSPSLSLQQTLTPGAELVASAHLDT